MLSQRQLFLQYLAQTSPFPLLLEITRAEGVYLYDSQGKSYLDLISGIAVSNVGHRHPKVVEAIKAQVDQFMHVMVYGEFVQSPQNQLAVKLSETLPNHLNNFYFVNSGTEAIEGAMKLAKRFTNRYEILSCYNAYHGSSQGALSLAGDEKFKSAFRPLLPGVKHIRFGYEEDLEKYISHKTAAVVIEPVQAEAGIRLAGQDYFRALREKCTETGTLLIYDEIQSGFGRTGKFWAFEHLGIQPDVLVCAKGMGGGMPIGVFIAPQEMMSVLKENPILGHITTFGGHPVCCAASLATLQVVLEEKLMEDVEEKATFFRSLLVHPKIKEIRSKGLLMAVEFESFAVLKPIIDRAIEKGILTDWFLFCDNAMRIAPPLVISKAQIREACEKLMEALDSVA